MTLDSLLAHPATQAGERLRALYPGLRVSLHAAAEWGEEPEKLALAKADLAQAHIVVSTLLFLDEHIRAIEPELRAARERVDCFVGAVAAPEVTSLTRMGALDMSAPDSTVMKFLKSLRGNKKASGASGEKQMRILRRLPKILRFLPGKAQDLRAYFLVMQYWLSGTEENVEAMLHFLIDRYADGPRAGLRGRARPADPALVPDTGVYHPRMPGRLSDDPSRLPAPPSSPQGRVGLLLMRSYVLAGDTRHYDAVIEALEARGLAVVPAFAAGLDGRPAMDAFFKDAEGRPEVDALISLTGFSLVGGPAYNDSAAAEEALSDLDVPYIAAHALEFQRLDQWQGSDRGLSPIESTMMVALPEIDGATGPIVFGGRLGEGGACDGCAQGCRARAERPRAMAPCPERIERLADRAARLTALRRAPRDARRIAIVLYGFPPNAGAVGTAAYLSVFESLLNTLRAMRDEGYAVEVPETVEALRDAVLRGNAADYGQDANVAAVVATDDMVRGEPHLAEIEAAWGPAPGKVQADGRGVFVLGARFGEVFVGVQPTFGYEGDPMRLLFEKGFAPTHAFNAFYRWIRRDFGAHAVLHYGMHGALEFMPGKQSGLGASCWPDRLIGDLPNIYLYAANNPSEGALAKRRSAATLVTYLTPPLAQAGLYKGLVELKSTLNRWRALAPGAAERGDLADLLQAQAAAVDLTEAAPAWTDPDAAALKLLRDLAEAEETWITDGLHVVGGRRSAESLADTLGVMAEAQGLDAAPELLADLALAARAHADAPEIAMIPPAGAPTTLVEAALALAKDSETAGLLRALDARFIAPAPGGDLVRAPNVLPTGRNMHAFDPFRMPSAFALLDGARQAAKLIERHVADHGELPRSVALVLWGADNLKTEGGPIAQALHLLGARPRFDGYGRLSGAELIPLE
ncbi:MAG: magnesium chelatase subunit H, partial [Pseudomonadota bacterium]